MVRNRIRHYREQLHFGLRAFADEIGVHPGQLSRWETNAQQPNVETYWRLWLYLRQRFPGLHLEDLMEEYDDIPASE